MKSSLKFWLIPNGLNAVEILCPNPRRDLILTFLIRKIYCLKFCCSLFNCSHILGLIQPSVKLFCENLAPKIVVDGMSEYKFQCFPKKGSFQNSQKLPKNFKNLQQIAFVIQCWHLPSFLLKLVIAEMRRQKTARNGLTTNNNIQVN